MLQDRKYDFSVGQVINRASGDPIPADEPVIVFRARDRKALDALAAYMLACRDSEHRAAMCRRMLDFAEFAAAHPERMKEPDTDTSDRDAWGFTPTEQLEVLDGN